MKTIKTLPKNFKAGRKIWLKAFEGNPKEQVTLLSRKIDNGTIMVEGNDGGDPDIDTLMEVPVDQILLPRKKKK